MKNSKYMFGLIFCMLAFFTSCDDENYEFGDLQAPSNVQITAEVVGADADNPYGDGSGQVNFKASADHVITYKYIYEGAGSMAPNGEMQYNFGKTGVFTYTVTVEAIGKGGLSSTASTQVEVLALYAPPADLITDLTGDGSKSWRVKAETAGHFGVGPPDETSPIWWSAAPYDKEGLGAYDDVITFNVDGTVNYKTNGTMYGQSGPLDSDFGIANQTPNGDGEYVNYPVDDFNDTWSLSAPGGQETLTFADKGYHGFYVGGSHSYAIISRTSTDLVLRTVGADSNGWFVILTSEEESPSPEDPDYTNLIWEDNFDETGAPDPTKWGYNIGTGDNGWGNNELQYYTDRADNVIVEDGLLKITAKKETYQGANYTSARLKTQDLFEFTYGRIDVRAKLAGGTGTWPAIWTLGANIDTEGWPKCGEIDIMEYSGHTPGQVSSAIHTPSSYGDTVNYKATSIENETSEFHVYSLIWSENQLSFLIDDVKFYSYNPTLTEDTWPFSKDQFIILNVAMGGTLGGDVDPEFTTSTMEIDYVKVFQ